MDKNGREKAATIAAPKADALRAVFAFHNANPALFASEFAKQMSGDSNSIVSFLELQAQCNNQFAQMWKGMNEGQRAGARAGALSMLHAHRANLHRQLAELDVFESELEAAIATD